MAGFPLPYRLDTTVWRVDVCGLLGFAEMARDESIVVLFYHVAWPLHFADVTHGSVFAFLIDTLAVAACERALKAEPLFFVLVDDRPASLFVQTLQSAIIGSPRRIVVEGNAMLGFDDDVFDVRKPLRSRVFSSPVVVPTGMPSKVRWLEAIRKEQVHVEVKLSLILRDVLAHHLFAC